MSIRLFFLLAVLVNSSAQAGLEQLISLGDLNTTGVDLQAVGPGAGLSSTAFFAAQDSEHGSELWRYNAGSAELWKDIRPGPESGNPSQFTAMGSYVVYVADDGVRGPELYTTANISASGFLGDVQPGATHPAPVILGASNGRLWFTTRGTAIDNPPDSITELWVTDGFSPAQKMGQFAAGSITQITVLSTQATIFFLARGFGAPTGYVELYRANATGSPIKIATLRTNAGTPMPPGPVYAATSGFVCYQFIDTNKEPWLYQVGSGANGQLIDIDGSTLDGQPASFVGNGTDRICFVANSSAGGREVWTTLGNTATTTLLADVNTGAGSSDPTSLQMSRGNPGVFFQTQSGPSLGLHYAEAGASPVFRQCDADMANTSLHTIVTATTIAYLRVEGGPLRLRVADGKTGSTYSTGPSFASVAKLWNSNGAAPQANGFHLVGTVSSMEKLYRLPSGDLLEVSVPTPSGGSAKPRNFFPFGTTEQFFVGDTNTQPTLYRLGSGVPTPVSMQMPPDSFSSNASSLTSEFTEAGGMLFFAANDGHDRRLFRSAMGLQNSAAPVSGIYDPEQLVEFQGRLFLIGRTSPGSANPKKLLQVEFDNGNVYPSVFNGPTGILATALKRAAGRLFVVENYNTTLEKLHSIDSTFSLTTINAFYRDAAGAGITQLTACPSYLFFTAQHSSSPTAKRVIWTTDGTPPSLTTPGASLFDTQLMGSLGDACLFWFVPGSGPAYRMFSWNPTGGAGPVNFYSSGNFDFPESHRVAGKPAGVELSGWFYFALQSGRLARVDGQTLELLSNSTLKVVPETLTALAGKVLFMGPDSNRYCRLFSFSPADSSITNFWVAPQPSLPCPFVTIGTRAWFTTCELDSNIGTTRLRRTDGTNEGTELVSQDLAQRKLANVPMGVYRGHLVLTAATHSGHGSLEPALFNTAPSVPLPTALQGLRAQPVTFTYAQLVNGLVTDSDGDTFTPLQLFNSYGTLSRNGTPIVGISTEIAPGDSFEWIPPPGDSGMLYPLYLSSSDDWNEGTAYQSIHLQTPYDLWRQAQFPVGVGDTDPPQNSGPEEDFNGNGVANIFEHLFGRDPKTSDATPGWELSTPANGSVVRYTFTRAGTLPQGAVLTVEYSPDLSPSSWNAAATKTENGPWSGSATVTETSLPDGRVEVKVEMPADTNHRFFRLNASY